MFLLQYTGSQCLFCVIWKYRYFRLYDYRTIIKFKDGVCSLADDNKCSVYRVRPIQCKAWPFWTENLDEWVWHEEVASICPGINRGRLYSKAEVEKIADEVNDVLEAEMEEA